jgi:hypothetical protein
MSDEWLVRFFLVVIGRDGSVFGLGTHRRLNLPSAAFPVRRRNLLKKSRDRFSS